MSSLDNQAERKIAVDLQTDDYGCYEHNDPDSLGPRSHPWIDGKSDPTHRYYDFRARPELIRSSLEDMQDWNSYPAAETFYRLLEWINGSESVFESNDCAFSGATANTSTQFSKRLQCSGRLMILYRDLALNRSPEQIHWLTNAAAHALRGTDPSIRMGSHRRHDHVGQIYDPARAAGTAAEKKKKKCQGRWSCMVSSSCCHFGHGERMNLR